MIFLPLLLIPSVELAQAGAEWIIDPRPTVENVERVLAPDQIRYNFFNVRWGSQSYLTSWTHHVVVDVDWRFDANGVRQVTRLTVRLRSEEDNGFLPLGRHR
jgi:hypothetical protein